MLRICLLCASERIEFGKYDKVPAWVRFVEH